MSGKRRRASTGHGSLALLLLLAACAGAEEAPARPEAAARFVVNRGTRGMSSRVRWLLSPDSAALLVVDDPVGVENDPVPDGVLHASERTGRVWRMDSVWTAAPSPDWRHVAVGRAVFLPGGRAQRIEPAQWRAAATALARIAGPHPALAADSLRARAFSASGMSVAEGAAATFVADVGADVAEAPMRFVTAGGWRVRWSCDGAELLVGDRPARALDDAPAAGERRVRVAGSGTASAPPAGSLAWVAGPSLEVGAPASLVPATTLHARGRTVVARGGRILVRDQAGAERDVGPGHPLAVTRGGRFILAIAPRSPARSHEPPDEAVVYRVP